MSKWIVAVPVWGAHYVDVFVRAAVPSYLAALSCAGLTGSDVEVVVYGDRAVVAPGLNMTMRPMPRNGDKYRQLGDVHRDAIARAPAGAKVMLLTADMVVSREVFAACDARFAAGRRIVLVGPSRTLLGAPLGQDMASRALLSWSLTHAHPFTKETFWGGRALPPSTMRFRKGDSVVMRGFHLHPLAVVRDRPMPFKGTLDQDLVALFDRSEIHVVTDADEMSAAELSRADLAYGRARAPVTVEDVVAWAKRQCLPANWWLSTHRIVLAGDGSGDDVRVWDKVMRSAPAEPAAARMAS